MAKKRKPVRSGARRAKAKRPEAARAEQERTGASSVPHSILDVIEKRFDDAMQFLVLDVKMDHAANGVALPLPDFGSSDYATYGNSHRWVPDVAKTMLLVKGRNELTGRQCRVYVRPGRRVTVVEDLN